MKFISRKEPALCKVVQKNEIKKINLEKQPTSNGPHTRRTYPKFTEPTSYRPRNRKVSRHWKALTVSIFWSREGPVNKLSSAPFPRIKHRPNEILGSSLWNLRIDGLEEYLAVHLPIVRNGHYSFVIHTSQCLPDVEPLILNWTESQRREVIILRYRTRNKPVFWWTFNIRRCYLI